MLQFIFVVFAAAAMAEVTHDGACPNLKPVENFNVTAYQGLWYEIQKFPNVQEKGGSCGTAEYTLAGDVIKVKNSHVVNGVQAVIEGTAKFAEDAKGAAKLLVTLNFGDKSVAAPLNIIATDYTGYGIAYACKFDEKTKKHSDSVWVLARNKKLEGEAKTAVDKFLKDHEKEIEPSKFVTTDFSEAACKFTSTSVITEPSPAKKQ